MVQGSTACCLLQNLSPAYLPAHWPIRGPMCNGFSVQGSCRVKLLETHLTTFLPVRLSVLGIYREAVLETKVEDQYAYLDKGMLGPFRDQLIAGATIELMLEIAHEVLEVPPVLHEDGEQPDCAECNPMLEGDLPDSNSSLMQLSL